jgi:hypothetical protein
MGLSAFATAQTNLMVNGDFEAGPSTVAPWVLSGLGGNPAVEMVSTTGGPASWAFGVSPFERFVQRLDQVVPTAGGSWYSLDVDVLYVGTGDEVVMRIVVDGIQYLSTCFGDPSSPRTFHLHVAWQALSPTGVVKAGFEFESLNGHAYSRLYVENVVMRQWDAPFIELPIDFHIGSASTFTVRGEPGLTRVLLLSAALAPSPLTVPGFRGRVELDLMSMLTAASGISGPTGLTVSRIVVPNVPSLAGVAFYFQAVEWNLLLGKFNIGSHRRAIVGS